MLVGRLGAPTCAEEHSCRLMRIPERNQHTNKSTYKHHILLLLLLLLLLNNHNTNITTTTTTTTTNATTNDNSNNNNTIDINIDIH